MAAVLVIGYGNPLRSDDGVGWRIAEAVGQQHAGDGRVEVLTCHQLLPEIAAKISESDYVIFVDAAEGGIAGQVEHKELNPQQCAGLSNHQVNHSSLLQLSREVYRRCPQASLITVSAGSFALGQELTHDVRQAMPAAIRMVEKCIGRLVTT